MISCKKRLPAWVVYGLIVCGVVGGASFLLLAGAAVDLRADMPSVETAAKSDASSALPTVEKPAPEKPTSENSATTKPIEKPIAKPQMTKLRTDVKPFEYVEAEIPFYPVSEKWGVQGEPFKQMQKPLEPAESIKHFITPVGFEVQLFAAEPDIGKPLCMAWDERGRLWIAETVDYPNELQAEGEGRDRIKICEDTDGDGRADKFTVFADKLSIPTSIAFSHGGVIVLQPPHTLFLKDTDGDDRADQRRIMFSGWGIGDTHAGPNNLHYGPDNWFYGIIGYSGYGTRINGERLSFRQGFFRFKPDGSDLEFLRNTTNNSWGVGFTEDGLLFGSTANKTPSVHMPIANRFYEAVRGWSSNVLKMISDDANYHPITDKVRQVDWHGKFTAAAGHAIYTARTYPREYWNRTAFVTDPTGHLVSTFTLRPHGADFRSRYDWNLLASDDEWSAPIMAEVGPDGHVWVIDWYNFIVQHNPTPIGYKTGRGNAYESDLRDKKHGRIYRVVYKDAKPVPTPKLHGGDVDEWVAALRHPNMLWRRHAQRLLVERGKLDVAPQLIALIGDPSVDEIGLNVAALHAIWTLNGLARANDRWPPEVAEALYSALRHPSSAVRRNAMLHLPASEESVAAILATKPLDDDDPLVRLAALLALAQQPASIPAADAVVATLLDRSNLDDGVLRDALTCAAAKNDQRFLELVAARDDGAMVKLSYDAAPVIRRVAEHYARGEPAEQINPVLAVLADAPAEVAGPIVTGFSRGWPRNAKAVKLNHAAGDALEKLMSRLPQQRAELSTLARKLGSDRLEKRSQELATSLLADTSDEAKSERDRLAAAGQLIDLRKADAEAAAKLLGLIGPRNSPEFAARLLETVGRSEARETGPAISACLSQLTPAQREVGIRLLLSRADWTPPLIEALENGSLSLADLSLDQKQALSSHPDKRIARHAAELFQRGGGLPTADRQKVLEEYLPLAERHGDAAAGKLVYTKQCGKCHKHSGEGGNVGPDLTGMAVHPKAELLTHILDPSRSVEGTYRAYTVVTLDGLVRTGLLTAEDKNSVEIVDAEGKSYRVLREDIDELKGSTKSLMPEGFEKQISSDEMVDLLEFLTQRGRYVPIPLEKYATVVTTQNMFNVQPTSRERIEFDDWSPKIVEGVPFQLVDPQGDKRPNGIMLYSPQGKTPPSMPRTVELPCNSPAKAVHLLGCVSGWGFPQGSKGSVSMIVRLHYADGQTEEHPLRNGYELADYNGIHEVPDSQLAFRLDRGRQVRYLFIEPKRRETIRRIELEKGPDETAPVMMAITVETPTE